MKTITEYEIYCQREVASHTRYLEFIQTHRATLVALNLTPQFWGGNGLDFNDLERPAVMAVLKAFPGTWAKSASYYNEGITYTLDHKVDGFTIRAYNCEPPPSCKIEETVEYIEVPARIERVVRRKVVCPEPVEAQNEPEL